MGVTGPRREDAMCADVHVKTIEMPYDAFGPGDLPFREVQEFTPATYAATKDEVLALVRCAATNRQTGRRLSHHLHHHFRFRDGKIASCRGSEDTAEVAAACEA